MSLGQEGTLTSFASYEPHRSYAAPTQNDVG